MEEQQPENPWNEERRIEIYIENVKGVRGIYPHSEIQLKVEFANEVILETNLIKMGDDIEFGEQIEFTMDYEDCTNYIRFLEYPLIFTLTEFECEAGNDVEISETGGKAIWRSMEEVAALKKALYGDDNEEEPNDKNDQIKQKLVSGRSEKDSKSRISKGSKSSLIQSRKISKGAMSVDIPKGPQCAGIGVLDLFPIFQGVQNFEENIILRADSKLVLDDRMKTIQQLPCLTVNVTIDNPIPAGSIYTLTIESIYNLPNVMSADLKYQACIHLPVANRKYVASFPKSTYKSEPQERFQFKKWSSTDMDTTYYMPEDFSNVRSKIELSSSIPSVTPRIEFNAIKRIYAKTEDLDVFKQQMRKYHCLGIEVFIQHDIENRPLSGSTGNMSRKTTARDKDSKAPSKDRKRTEANPKSDENCLHLMGFFDASQLLYAGEVSVRTPITLKTYNSQEFEAACGLKDSFFRPPLSELSEDAITTTRKSEKKLFSGKESVFGDKKGNLTSRLPSPPLPPKPSMQVYSENGSETLLLIEIEFNEPILPTRELADLHDELLQIIGVDQEEEKQPKSIDTEIMCEVFYKDTIKTILGTLREQYNEYLTQNDVEKKDEQNFIKYLQEEGHYQVHMSSIMQAAIKYAATSFHIDVKKFKDDHQEIISEIYIRLIEIMNSAINEKFIGHIGTSGPKFVNNSDSLLKYAHEAIELGAFALANRYLLQRICENETNPDYWFDYAIFNMHINETEMATECALEALKINPMHRNSLLFYALMLNKKGRYLEAESCLLNVTLNSPDWLEGWGALYCIYQYRNCIEGKEVTIDIAKKNCKKVEGGKIHDLAWCESLAPNTLFFRAASYFISLRLFDEAEIMLAEELDNQNQQLNEYLLAVISYYKQDYEHALLHIDNSIVIGGCDYTKCSFKGHIYASQEKHEYAIENYKRIFELFAQPEEPYLYLVYLRSGLCYSRMGNVSKARHAFLQANAINGGTPYTWLCTGILYYHEKDYLSAEQCLSKSNQLDNLMPETWAYLALANVQLKRKQEAIACCHEMVKNNLQNQEILMHVKKMIAEMK